MLLATQKEDVGKIWKHGWVNYDLFRHVSSLGVTHVQGGREKEGGRTDRMTSAGSGMAFGEGGEESRQEEVDDVQTEDTAEPF